MKKYKVFNNKMFISTSEAYYGNIIMTDKKIIIPYSNVFLMENDNNELPNNLYLNFCYIIFEGVEFIVWDYEKRNLLNLDSECYGGENFFLGNYSEFWISFDICSIILLDDKNQYRDKPFSKIDLNNYKMMKIFFNSNDDIKDFEF